MFFEKLLKISVFFVGIVFGILILFALGVMLFSLTSELMRDAFGEFSVEDKPSFSVNTHGNIDYRSWDLSATYPLDFVNGYIGAEWMHSQTDEDEDVHHFIRARMEGGYHVGIFGLRGYGRYGKKSASAQESLFHGGGFLHIDVIDKPTLKFNAGVGTWLSQEELHADYDVDTDMEWGPQAHLELQLANISVLAEFLPTHTFDNYQFRVLPIVIIPVTKVLFAKSVALEVTGEIYYDSITHHLEIKPWHYHWKNALRFTF